MKVSDITIIENSEYELIQQQHTEDKMYRSTQFKSYYQICRIRYRPEKSIK